MVQTLSTLGSYPRQMVEKAAHHDSHMTNRGFSALERELKPDSLLRPFDLLTGLNSSPLLEWHRDCLYISQIHKIIRK